MKAEIKWRVLLKQPPAKEVGFKQKPRSSGFFVRLGVKIQQISIIRING